MAIEVQKKKFKVPVNQVAGWHQEACRFAARNFKPASPCFRKPFIKGLEVIPKTALNAIFIRFFEVSARG
ncbi:MAG: hypothetical protein HY231_19995 [Acidobacteria bacterium]|nr:hypothetical protein [Acidobacteriota bacterium]